MDNNQMQRNRHNTEEKINATLPSQELAPKMAEIAQPLFSTVLTSTTAVLKLCWFTALSDFFLGQTLGQKKYLLLSSKSKQLNML